MKTAVVPLPGLNRDRDMIAADREESRAAAAHRLAGPIREIPPVDLIVVPGGFFPMATILRCGAIRRAHARHAGRCRTAAARRAGARRVSTASRFSSKPGVCLAWRAHAQRIAQVRLPRGEARSGQRRGPALPRIATPKGEVIRCPVCPHHDGKYFADAEDACPHRRRWAGRLPLMRRPPTRTARSTTSPASSTIVAMCSASCRIPKT